LNQIFNFDFDRNFCLANMIYIIVCLTDIFCEQNDNKLLKFIMVVSTFREKDIMITTVSFIRRINVHKYIHTYIKQKHTLNNYYIFYSCNN